MGRWNPDRIIDWMGNRNADFLGGLESNRYVRSSSLTGWGGLTPESTVQRIFRHNPQFRFILLAQRSPREIFLADCDLPQAFVETGHRPQPWTSLISERFLVFLFEREKDALMAKMLLNDGRDWAMMRTSKWVEETWRESLIIDQTPDL